MATDEVILARTLGAVSTATATGTSSSPRSLYRPYRVRAGGARVACVFRDHALSDLIGFTYAVWEAEAAADDFVGRLARPAAGFAQRDRRGEPLISVILDGENAWEHFEGGGRPFLRALYGALATHPELRPSRWPRRARARRTSLARHLPRLVDQRRLLHLDRPSRTTTGPGASSPTRAQALDAPGRRRTQAALARAREELLIAEGSDWFWWYGDDHSSDHDLEFDDLFRRHLRNVYRALGKPIPDELFVTNITTEPPRTVARAAVGVRQRRPSTAR